MANPDKYMVLVIRYVFEVSIFKAKAKMLVIFKIRAKPVVCQAKARQVAFEFYTILCDNSILCVTGQINLIPSVMNCKTASVAQTEQLVG